MIIQNTTHWIDQAEIVKYLHDVKKYPPLTREQEYEIIQKIKNGCEESKKILIYSNLRFVIKMAKKYQNMGLQLLDLISEGNYGLLKAAERYNYEQHDVRFLSYAVWWIKQSILQALHENSRLIRLPNNIINELAKLKKESPQNYSGEFISPDDIMGLPSITYLDKPTNDDGYSMYETIEDTNFDRPDVIFKQDKEHLVNKLKNVLSNLNEVEFIIITKYFGLYDDPLSLQDISEILNITKERVRQIKEKSIKKLRFYSRELFELL